MKTWVKQRRKSYKTFEILFLHFRLKCIIYYHHYYHHLSFAQYRAKFHKLVSINFSVNTTNTCIVQKPILSNLALDHGLEWDVVKRITFANSAFDKLIHVWKITYYSIKPDFKLFYNIFLSMVMRTIVVNLGRWLSS